MEFVVILGFIILLTLGLLVAFIMLKKLSPSKADILLEKEIRPSIMLIKYKKISKSNDLTFKQKCDLIDEWEKGIDDALEFVDLATEDHPSNVVNLIVRKAS